MINVLYVFETDGSEMASSELAISVFANISKISWMLGEEWYEFIGNEKVDLRLYG